MPLITPHNGESRSDFVARCMSDPKMQEEFGSQSQRLAVCNSLFDGKASLTLYEELKTSLGHLAGVVARLETRIVELEQREPAVSFDKNIRDALRHPNT